ncbi:MAG: AAA family ATPase [Planctomycetota bacterium]|jgi:adenylate kinase family enzyme
MSYSSELIAVVGPTGGGKSTSTENLNPSETFYINLSNKPLPFRGWMNKYKPYSSKTEEGKKGNYYNSNISDVIVALLQNISDNMPHIKYIIIDDYQYLMADEFMRRAYEKGWDKYTELARHAYDILDKSRNLRADIKVFVLTHDEVVKEGVNQRRKIKTIGNLLDDKISLEGMFTYVLFTHTEKVAGKDEPEYYFITNTDGYTTAKSPKGCLPYKMPNDLAKVAKAIDAYKVG